MPGRQLKCKNCGGINFKKIGVNSYQCLDCGQARRSPKHTNISITRRQIPKESISTSKDYKPLVAYCGKCGEKIDRIGHPRDERRLNNKWGKHTCLVIKKDEVFYT